MRKADKRRLGAERAEREAELTRQTGLEAQKKDRDRREMIAKKKRDAEVLARKSESTKEAFGKLGSAAKKASSAIDELLAVPGFKKVGGYERVGESEGYQDTSIDLTRRK